jgi:hypothetical protein
MRRRTLDNRTFPFWLFFGTFLAALDVLYMLLVWAPLRDKNLAVDDYQIVAQVQAEPALLRVLGGVLALALPCLAAPLVLGLLIATILIWREASVGTRLLRALLFTFTLAVFVIAWPILGAGVAWYYAW